MEAKREMFSLTTFIKNVQSTIKKVGQFALNNVGYILVTIGIAAKAYEAYIADFNMPLSFYTDTALDMLIMGGWLKYLFADDGILRRRLATCVF